MAEHAAVNRRVVGSSPTRGAKPDVQKRVGFFVIATYRGRKVEIALFNRILAHPFTKRLLVCWFPFLMTIAVCLV